MSNTHTHTRTFTANDPATSEYVNDRLLRNAPGGGRLAGGGVLAMQCGPDCDA